MAMVVNQTVRTHVPHPIVRRCRYAQSYPLSLP